MKRVIWTGKRPPTAAEKRAIARGVRSGAIRNGDRVAPVRVRKNPSRSSSAARAFKAFHWGNDPDKIENLRLPNYRTLYKLGDLYAVEYLTDKGRERAVWVHKFGRKRPVLTATPSGKLGPIIGGSARVTPRGIEG